jgi:UDP-N-acetylglucosamine--N-acetylmuramyl-(pentapeptide) pyrophosphoryl-undecaprenol N-acetylglucosamine transferase
LHEIGAAFAAADLAISRAGASTLGEYPLFGLPAILVPYPHAWRYQKVNADYLAKHSAAVVLEDSRLPEDLVALVKSLLADSQKLSQMRNSMKSLAAPGAADRIADMLVGLSTKKAGRIQP